MYWLVYIVSTLAISLFLAKINKKYFFELLVILIIFFITPAQIEISTFKYAPSVFTFIFNVILEQDYSLRVLRPLFLSLPLGIAFIFLYLILKRKFF